MEKFDRCFSQLKKVNLILTTISFLMVIYLFIILPQEIPVQIAPGDFLSEGAFQIGNYGSKFTLLLLPLYCGLFTFIFSYPGLVSIYGKYSGKTFFVQVIVTLTSLVLWLGIYAYLFFSCLLAMSGKTLK